MPLPTLKTSKQLAAVGTAAGTGFMILVVKILNQSCPDCFFTEFLSADIVALLTGLSSFIATFLLTIIVALCEDFKAKWNIDRLQELKDRYPDNPDVLKSIEEAVARRAKALVADRK